MKHPTSTSVFHLPGYRRLAMILAVGGVVLGLIATGLLKVRAQSKSRPTTELAEPLASQTKTDTITGSESAIVNWPNDGRKRVSFDDYLRSLRGDERMSARVIPTRVGNGNPQSIIVIYGGHGQVICCIGRASACKELMN